MPLPVHWPTAEVAPALPAGSRVTVAALCRRAGIPCHVTGPPARRPVRLAVSKLLRAVRLPGPFGEVWLGVPRGARRRVALVALGMLAYGVFDYTARESLRGVAAGRPGPGRGRPRTGRALSNAERQRRYRSRNRR